ncbi:farnesyl pyrophosphate synthase-like isoform X1 [Varroa jacobsoni]|nr:farnesyl pyrophosphate synthase-like isoform X2 [Varroa destructor]XP_022685803.1 farnesyl pyrophosphate synthase-like isoform X1 [Varroa jacobsoni]XP_022685804.1 farnesyl pyrophosphate synthase-like isoform X1 [Varroa jacobsoni]
MGLFDVNAKIQVDKADHLVVERAFNRIRDLSKCSQEDPGLSAVSDWLDRVLMYNIPHGKRWRLLQVVQAFETFSSEPVSERDLENAAILGWTIEIFQAFYLIIDDIMDKSITRRGSPCWYLVDEVGMMAINDALLLETIIFQVLKQVFRDHPSYLDIVELLHEVHYQTVRGQCLDVLSERKRVYGEERYNTIVLYKTCFYTFSVPIRLGMYLAKITSSQLHRKVEKLAVKIGNIFQVQDDFLDCYGDPAKLGKVGTDIVDAKCSWLLVKALQIATPQQREEIFNNIGRGKPAGEEEATVRSIYHKLGLEELFRTYEESSFEEIRKDIATLDSDGEINTDIFKLTVNKLYRRQK